MPRRKRALTAEDRAVWEQVAARTRPLHPLRDVSSDAPGGASALPAKKRPSTQPMTRIDPEPRKAAFAPSIDAAPSLQDRLAQSGPHLDRRTNTRLKKGKLKPDARLDLHGMTQNRAHPALTRFILDASGRGHKMVLVITGKGKVRDDGGPMPVPLGVLRHNVPHWLNSAPLKQIVLRVGQAHLRHGGGGAYYVWLRRAR